MAEKYYQKGEFKEAIKWAKNANIQNKKNPLSWIITAKALYKLGKKEEAIKILKIYNTYNSSKDIEELLRKYKNEK